jgi:GTP-binding protein
MAGSEGRNPIADLGTLREELKLHDPTLAKRPWVVIANKMDLPEAEANLKAFKRRFRKREVIPISASENQGIEALKERLHELIGRRADAPSSPAP